MAEEPHTDSTEPRRRARRRGRFGWWMFFTNVLAVVILLYAVLAFSGRSVPLPGWAADAVSDRVSASVAPNRVAIGGIAVAIGADGLPQALLRDVEIRDAQGSGFARLNDVETRLAPQALIRGVIAPQSLDLSGAQITVRRSGDGGITLAFGGDGGISGATPADLVRVVDKALDMPILAHLDSVAARAITVALEDARSGRIWQAVDADLNLQITPDTINAALISDVFNGTEDLASVQLTTTAHRDDGRVDLGASLRDVASRDIALQSPALSFLGVLNAGIDGSVRATLDTDGRVSALAATLDVAAGALQPEPGARFSFDSARVYLTYDPARDRLDFSELSMASDRLSVAGSGHAYLRDLAGAWPSRLTGHLQIDTLSVAGEQSFADDINMSRGAADINVHLDPFRVEIGQLALVGETGGRVTASGAVQARDDGWQIGLDFAAPVLDPAEVLALWPLDAIRGTRNWVATNVIGGRLVDTVGGVRLVPGAPPEIALSFDIEAAEVRFLEHFPPVTDGYGRSTFEDNAYTLVLSRGTVTARTGASVDVTGSVFRVEDVRPVVPTADITLLTSGPLDAVLTLLNNPPFEILEKSGLPPDLARAQVEGKSEISVPMLKVVERDDVAFRTRGVLRDVQSDDLIPGRALRADALDVRIDPEGLVLSGRGSAGAVPVFARWRQAFAAGEADTSHLEATIDVTPEGLAELGLAADAVGARGATTAELALVLPRDGPASFALNSDLQGLSLSLPDLAWSKPAPTSGQLSVTGRLDPLLAVDDITFSSPGLSLAGVVAQGDDGVISTIQLDQLRVGDWFDGRAQLGLGVGGPPAVTILGGRLDLRNRPGPSGPARPRRMDVALDALVISDTISLRPFSARLPGPGQSGRFDARVNGRTPINGDLIPQSRGMALRLRSDNGGGVLSDAGILRGGVGGEFRALLVPGEVPGSLDGEAQVEGMVLRDAPAIARLLDSVSIVGLIDEINGPGIAFDSVDARFWIGEGEVRLYHAAAVGASLGISVDGTVDTARDTLDLQGVVSPFYLFNGVGSFMTRPGEGLFGVSFRMAGDTRQPQLSVNPLSILTPGMFRDIFRRPPPAAPDALQ